MKTSAYWSMALFFVSVVSWAAPAKKCRYEDFKNSESERGRVIRVVDGDTARIQMRGFEYTVRMNGIDTPETHYEGKSQGIWAEKAAAHLMGLLPPGTVVQIEFGENPCDNYGRVLGNIWADGLDMNREMVKDAFAVNYCIAPAQDCHELALLTRTNIQERAGIFAPGGPELPYEWRRIVSKRPYEKFVGNLFTYEVYAPGSLDRVPVSDRIFFMNEKDIPSYYRRMDRASSN